MPDIDATAHLPEEYVTFTVFGVDTSGVMDTIHSVAVNALLVSVDAIYAVADTVEEFALSFFTALHSI